MVPVEAVADLVLLVEPQVQFLIRHPPEQEE
jgi:hypothetical protein